MMEWIESIDHEIFLFINGMHHPAADTFFEFCSGTLSWIPIYALILWQLIRQFKSRVWLPVLLLVLCVVATDQASVHLFKNVFQRYRPCHHLQIGQFVHLVNGHCGGHYGFLSSHAANTAGFAVLTSIFLKQQWLRVSLVLWVFLNMYSRVYLGVHYPSDVFAGAMLGIAIATLLGYVQQKLIPLAPRE